MYTVQCILHDSTLGSIQHTLGMIWQALPHMHITRQQKATWQLCIGRSRYRWDPKHKHTIWTVGPSR